MRSKIIITGGNGGIGFALAERLSKEHSVLVLDKQITKKFSKGIRAIEYDLIKPETWKYFEDADYIFHLACIKPSEGGTTKEEYRKNLGMTENVAKYNKSAKVIYPSAGTIYGSQTIFPINESARITCDISDYYCRGKLENEQILERYSRKNNWPLVVLRITNIYGLEFRRKGEILTEFFLQLVNNKPIKIYGDGNQKRDRIFIDDLVEALCLSMPENVDGVFNIGSEESYSTNKVLRIMSKILKRKPKDIEFEASRGFQRDDNLLDISKAKKIMGFKPKIRFKKGLKTFLKQWEKEWNSWI